MEIEVVKRGGEAAARYEVVIKDDGEERRHVVTVPANYAATLGVDVSNDAAVHDLLRRSFAFLLVREPKEAILKQFILSDIEQYFPEYPNHIQV